MLGVSRFRVQTTLLMVGPHGTTKFATEKESRFMNHYGTVQIDTRCIKNSIV